MLLRARINPVVLVIPRPSNRPVPTPDLPTSSPTDESRRSFSVGGSLSLPRPSLNPALFAALALTFTLAISPPVSAQDAVPADIAPPTNPGLTAREINAIQGQEGVPAGAAVTGQQLAETPRRLNYGLTLTVRGVYDDNINISSFNKVSDYYISIEPSIFFGFGGKGDETAGSSSVSFVYRPQVFLFVDHSENDTVQHLIHLQASHIFGRLAMSLSQDVQILDGADLNSLSDPTGHNANTDIGQRTKHNIYTTQISDTYDLTGKLFFSNGFGLTIDDYPSQFISSKNISGNLFLNYNYSEKVVIGIGGTGGYNTVDASSPDQTYEQANVRVSYAATGKVSFSASGGAEFRQFQDITIATPTGTPLTSRGTEINPVFDLSGSYKPFDGTTITVAGSRRIQNSAALGGQDYTSTDLHLTVGQRFLSRFTLGLAVGYNKSQYFSTLQGLSANRDDDFYYVQPTVDANVTRWWTAGGYYIYRKNSSSLALFGFDDNQFGLRSTITF
jgi:hypothetical protein